MNKKYKDSKVRLHFIILGFIIISTFFLSIGYASFESITLDINGKVSAVPQSDIYISNVEYSTNINANTENSIIHQYYQTTLYSTIFLGNSNNSSITYNITIYNSSDTPYTFNSIEYSDEFYDNYNIVYELDGLKKGDILLSNQQLTFSIKFHYKDNVIASNNILNSYLNFKFIKGTNPDGTADINNIVTNANKIMIYNAETDKVLIDITNNNYVAMNLNLMIEDNIIDTISIEPQQSKAIEKSIKEILGNLQTNKEYEIIIKQAESSSQKKASSVKIQVFPTITNYCFGLKVDGTEENPYIIYKIEDFIRLAQKVNSGDTFTNKYLKQINNLDFKNQADYYSSNDTSFGNLNKNNNDNNQIFTEMTTGTGFIMIGSMENPFQGIFDGNNNKVDNILINSTDTSESGDMRIGFFRYISNSTIKNLTLSGNYNIVKDGGGFIGGILGNCNIINCHNNINITNSVANFSVGGIVGYLVPNSNVLIDNCANNATVTNVNNTGGLAGLVHNSILTITNSKNTGTVDSTSNSSNFAGGLVSKDNSTGATIIIKNSQNSGTVRGHTNVGAYVGKCFGSLTTENCTNTGNIINESNSKILSNNEQTVEPSSTEETQSEAMNIQNKTSDI